MVVAAVRKEGEEQVAREVRRMIGSELLRVVGSALQVEQADTYSDYRWNYSTIRFRDEAGWWMVHWQAHRSGDSRELELMFEVVPIVRKVQVVVVEQVTWELEQ